MSLAGWMKEHVRLLWLLGAAAAYIALAAYQLGLPGLHYDEAKEAGVNAMELLRNMPVTAFRGATVNFLGIEWPLMVQDYIGALNVFLAAPILGVTGVGVPNLRVVSVLTGLAALLLAERAASEWIACCDGVTVERRAPISLAGLVAVALLAVSPSFVFWSRQGIFVTNLMQPFCLLSVWQGVRWMRTQRPAALVWSALAAGLALYAKLMAIWIVGPFVLLMAGWWLWRRTHWGLDASALSWRLLLLAAVAFALPLAPVALFNLKTGGTLSALLGNAGRSYYGVDNLNLPANLHVRMGQLVQVLRGEQFWYLGGSYVNRVAPWLAALSVAGGLWRAPRCTWPPIALASMAALASVFTISDLFVTHFALLFPFVVLAAAVALDRVWMTTAESGGREQIVRGLVVAGVTVWIAGSLWSAVSYHRALTRSGGLSDHSDASYHLAYYLRYNGLGAPIVLDWGMEAPVRFLSEGAVRPIEIFGYGSLDGADEQFEDRLAQFLPNADNVYLLHAPEHTVFAGRREAFVHAALANGLEAVLLESFGQRDGQTLYEVWRVLKADDGVGE